MLTQQSTICREYHGKTGYLLGNVDMGIWEFAGIGYHMNDMQTMQTIKSQLMMSCGSHTKQSHKSIAQMNCTRQDDIICRIMRLTTFNSSSSICQQVGF